MDKSVFAWVLVALAGFLSAVLILQLIGRASLDVGPDLRSLVLPCVTMMLAVSFMCSAFFRARAPFRVATAMLLLIGAPAYVYACSLVGTGPLQGPGFLILTGLFSLSSIATGLVYRNPRIREMSNLPAVLGDA